MSITYEELNSLLPQIGEKTISVGFRSAESIQPIINLFDTYFGKRYKRTIEETSRAEIDTAKTLSDINKREEKEVNEVKKRHEELKQAISKNNEDRTELFKNRLLLISEIALKVGKRQFEISTQFTNFARQIESSGLLLKGGIDQFMNDADQLGYTYQQWADTLSKSAPNIIKLTGVYGNGAETFKSLLKDISKDYALTHNEQQAVVNAYVEQQAQIGLLNKQNRDELQSGVNDLAKRMKELSQITGKSVEELTKEVQMKSNIRRVEAFRTSGKQQAQVVERLRSLGMDDNKIANLLAGGMLDPASLVLEKQGDATAGAFNAYAIRALQTGNYDALSQDGIIQFAKQNKNLIDATKQRHNIYSQNASMQLVAGQNEDSSNYIFGQGGNDAFLNLLQNIEGKENNNISKKERQSTLNNLNASQSLVEKFNTATNQWLKAQYIGLDNSTKLYKTLEFGADVHNKIFEGYNKLREKNDFFRALTGVGGTLAAQNKDKIVNFLIEKASSVIVGGKNLGSLDSNGKFGTSDSDGFGVSDAATSGGLLYLTKKFLPTLLKRGGQAASVIQSGMVLSDFASNGVSNTVNDYKENWGGWDWLNPSKMMAVAGDWAGDYAGDFMHWISGGMSEDERRKMVNDSLKYAKIPQNTTMEMSQSNIDISTERENENNVKNKYLEYLEEIIGLLRNFVGLQEDGLLYNKLQTNQFEDYNLNRRI